MHRWILIASAALCACGGARPAPSTETTSPYNNASYAFSAATPNANVQGKILVNSSGTFVDFDTPCQGGAVTSLGGIPSGMPSVSSATRYYCGGAWLVFDRRNPAGAARWFATVESPRSRRVCDSYATQNGRQVCTSYRNETYYVSETRTGGIQVQRILQD
jgi:hypothetical protein